MNLLFKSSGSRSICPIQISLRFPPESKNCNGYPSPPVTTWTFVVNPPPLRPVSSWYPLFWPHWHDVVLSLLYCPAWPSADEGTHSFAPQICDSGSVIVTQCTSSILRSTALQNHKSVVQNSFGPQVLSFSDWQSNGIRRTGHTLSDGNAASCQKTVLGACILLFSEEQKNLLPYTSTHPCPKAAEYTLPGFKSFRNITPEDTST